MGSEMCIRDRMKNMIINSLAVAEAAKEIRDCRGGHTRLDYPEYDKELGTLNISLEKGQMA